jgi:tRNA-dihydrouridine synthase C
MRIFMAPMEGVVDAKVRQLYAALGGVDVFVTEFIRITDTLLPVKVFLRYCPELTQPLPLPVRVQLLGNNCQMLAENAQRAAALGAPGIDLNFGCPAKTVNRHRGGACLLQEPDTLYAIVRAVREAVPASIPVTAKMRLGYQARSGYLENAQAIAAAGAAELVVHGRSKADGYAPPAYWDTVGEVRASLSIPVVVNGDIWSLQDCLRAQAESGCQDVMLGRSLLAKPDLALEIKAHAAGTDFTPLQWRQVAQKVWAYHQSTQPDYDLRYQGNRLKQWLMYLKRQYPQAALLFDALKKLRDTQALEDAYQAHLNGLQAEEPSVCQAAFES